MKLVKTIVFSLNLFLWIAASIFLIAVNFYIGLSLTLGIVFFLIGWYLSGGTVVAPIDTFLNPEWKVFLIKIKWANSVGLTSSFIIYGVFYVFLINNIIE